MRKLRPSILVFDTETTGLDEMRGPEEQPHELVEIAAVWLRSLGSIEPHRSTLIRPCRAMTPGASSTHGLIDQDLVNAPSARDVLPTFFPDGSYLIAGHNLVAFDWPHVADYVEGRALIDTLQCARVMYPEAPDHKAGTLFYWLLEKGKIGDFDRAHVWPSHRAMTDAYMEALLLRALLREATVGELIHWTKFPLFLTRCFWNGFRNYPKGTLLSEFDNYSLSVLANVAGQRRCYAELETGARLSLALQEIKLTYREALNRVQPSPDFIRDLNQRAGAHYSCVQGAVRERQPIATEAARAPAQTPA